MDISESLIISQNEEETPLDNLSIDFECNSPEIVNNEVETTTNCGEVRLARLEFEKIFQGINEEEKRLQDLEERRKKLESDMERLQEEIEKEKQMFRQAIDAEINKKREIDLNSQDLTAEKFYYPPKIDPLNINYEDVQSKLKEYREVMEESQLQPVHVYEGDEDIKRLKCNLANYKKVLEDSSKEKIVKQKRKAAAKMFQRHLDEVDLKCTEQIGKLVTIQKSIESIAVSGDGINAKNE